MIWYRFETRVQPSICDISCGYLCSYLCIARGRVDVKTYAVETDPAIQKCSNFESSQSCSPASGGNSQKFEYFVGQVPCDTPRYCSGLHHRPVISPETPLYVISYAPLSSSDVQLYSMIKTIMLEHEQILEKLKWGAEFNKLRILQWIKRRRRPKLESKVCLRDNLWKER